MSKFRPYVTLCSTQFIISPWLLWCPCSRPDRWPRMINPRRCLSLWHSWGYPVYTGLLKSNVTTAVCPIYLNSTLQPYAPYLSLCQKRLGLPVVPWWWQNFQSLLRSLSSRACWRLLPSSFPLRCPHDYVFILKLDLIWKLWPKIWLFKVQWQAKTHRLLLLTLLYNHLVTAIFKWNTGYIL